VQCILLAISELEADDETDGAIGESYAVSEHEAYDAPSDEKGRSDQHAFLWHRLERGRMCPRESLSNGK